MIVILFFYIRLIGKKLEKKKGRINLSSERWKLKKWNRKKCKWKK